MATILSDDFSDAGDPDLNGKAADVGGNWTVQTGTMTVDSGIGRAYNAEALGTSIATLDAGAADGTITCTVQPANATSIVGVIFRWADSSNYWRVVVNVAAGKFHLYRVEAGTPTAVDEVNGTITEDADHDITVTFNGTSITATVDALEVNGTSSFNETETEHGVYAEGSNDLFDDFLMTDAVPVDPATFPFPFCHPPRREATRVASY